MTRDFEVLDLFCGAGGAAMGIHRALVAANISHKIIGVDIVNQPRYPFCFRLANAMHYPLEHFDFIWASPPCQAYTIAGRNMRAAGMIYPDLVAPTRERLQATDADWCMENVPGAPMTPDLILCGSHFGLNLARHRLFEFSRKMLLLVPSCAHAKDLVTVCGDGTPSWTRKRRMLRGLPANNTAAEKREAMGIDWMRRNELCQAIPPAYSEFIFRQFLAQLHGSRGTSHESRITNHAK